MTDKINAVKGLWWARSIKVLLRNIKFILWDVWRGGF